MSRSETLFSNAQKYIPGGVSSPVRTFRSVNDTPLLFKHAEGAYVLDEDDGCYVDCVGSWGSIILGHSHPDVLDAVRRQLDHGPSYGAPTALEIGMADLVYSMVPSIEMVRTANSGIEATMSAIRLARDYTGYDSIIRFEGCYHGHSDSLLVKADSDALTFGVPNSPDVPAAFTKYTLTLPFSDIETVRKTLGEVGKGVTYVIAEPIAGSINYMPPAPGFLGGLCEACDEHDVVLIFDEVMTGFRAVLGDTQAYYGVTPDLSTFGKTIGSDMPVGAFDDKREIMQQISPLNPVYQAGMLSDNSLAVAVGLTALRLISHPGSHDELTAYTMRMLDGLQQRADAAGVPFVTTQAGSMFGLYSSDADAIVTFEDVMASDVEGFKRSFHLMLDGGVYLAPSAFKTGFTSIAHGNKELEITLNVTEKASATLK